MNLWGKGFFSLLITLLILFACEEDASYVGFQKPNTQFKVIYAEVDLTSSVIWFDKMATFNNVTDGDQRFLIGEYTDPEFGHIKSEIYTQFSAPISAASVGSTAVADSLVLQLRTDFYHYGSPDMSDHTIEVHELSDTIHSGSNYYSSSKVAYSPDVLGETTFSVNPAIYDQNIEANNDTDTSNNKVQTFRVRISGPMGSNLLKSTREESALINNFDAFSGKYKGFAILHKGGDHIIGINPTVTGTYSAINDTKLMLYYTDDGVQKRLDFVLFPFNNQRTGQSNLALGFSSIDTDRTGTPLQNITSPDDFYPADGKRYLQSGTGVMTKLNFENYFKYVDTVKNMTLNSAEIVVTNEASDFAPPPRFQMRALDANNRFRSAVVKDSTINGVTTSVLDTEFIKFYQASTKLNLDGTVDIKGDNGDVLYMAATTDNVMTAYLTQFFQVQYGARNSSKRINSVAFMPIETTFRKSVNRFIPTGFKVRFYYTTPILQANKD